MPEIFDARRVLADELLFHMVYRRDDYRLLVGISRLAQSHQTFIGMHPHDGPFAARRVNEQRVDIANFHGFSLTTWLRNGVQYK